MLECVSIVGLGKLGAPMAAAIASKGVRVIGVDIDENKVNAIGRAEPPVYEPGLSELLQQAKANLTATTDLQQAVLDSQATFIVVATPSRLDGHFSLDYVLDACKVIGQALREKSDWHIVVITSTVSPLSMDEQIRPFLEEVSGKRASIDFGLAYNPEFIALGTVIRDFLNPDLILIGESDPKTGDTLQAFYMRILDNIPAFARMNFVNAELTKLSINTFVTTKISFANMLARICERLPGSDVDVVTAALGKDSRIGPKYLRGAVSYGGPCFPRDNLALIALARQIGAIADVAETTDNFNRSQNAWLAEFVYQHVLPGQVVGVLGLAYKPGSDVIEESPAIYLLRYLLDKQVSVVAYDPAARANAEQLFRDRVRWAASAEACVTASEVVVIPTVWPEFKKIPTSVWIGGASKRTVIDCWRAFPELSQADGLRYVSLGQGPSRVRVPV
ncbi:MAG: nucleotide sugar dehydrogenase [Bacteroidia bacterium]|nr:nucleotide sugar dehydrogenase [Bacteroidia bacterium]